MMPPYTVANLVRAAQTEMEYRDAKRERRARHVHVVSETNANETETTTPSRQPRFHLLARLVGYYRPELEVARPCQCYVDRGCC
jgi:hypothetical protein